MSAEIKPGDKIRINWPSDKSPLRDAEVEVIFTDNELGIYDPGDLRVYVIDDDGVPCPDIVPPSCVKEHIAAKKETP